MKLKIFKKNFIIIFKGHLHAEIVLEQVDARRVVVTGFALARTDIDLAPFSRPTGRALARERVHAVVTFAVVHARRRSAIVHVLLAHLPGVSRMAHALVVVVQVQTLFRALGAARVAQTLVDAGFALETQETGSAAADEPVQHVYARSAVLARAGRAIVDQMLTPFAGVADVARA